ncbi:MAG: ComEC/Rec2 family competence protein [Oscillatoriales cyanobacterium C42_A2020_001]|nr:ComEC/Rec2 family competence protein [Leptolyngbyaceae cyanobacterium C42_A2020_001]
MGSASAATVCWAFILGLLFTAIPYGGWILLSIGVLASLLFSRFGKSALPGNHWAIAGVIALLATVYFQLRIPQPPAYDISRLLSPTEDSLEVLVEGEVTSLPRLTRNQKAQFWLQAQGIAPIGDGKVVTGKVYVTVPPDQATTLHPGQRVSVSGSLYLPKPAVNPHGFDFKEFLQKEGSFTGLRGDRVELRQDVSGWGWWQIQQRIVQAQQKSLGTPEGALVSAMVLGGRAVDLPYPVKDAFVRVGLAHALAASGFQTSLILGVVLALTRRFSERVQCGIGTLALASFVGLAGLQPAVLRAALMGFGGLVALGLNRKVKPLGSMLLTATILLIVNPLWIWDLGFQLSFLATLGLLVTVPPLSKRLDWMPSAIAPLVAVPIAAYLWTLPLQLGAFGVLSPYSIPANLITTPFISLISLGGMASALVAIVWIDGGSGLAWLLKYPTQALIAIVNGFNQLPGNAYAIGTISVITVLILYGLLGLSSFHRWWQRRWWMAFAASLVLLLLPLGAGATLTSVTILATNREPAMVVRDRGRVLVMGGSDSQTAQFTLLPYLQKNGINQIDWAIALDSQAATNWNTVAQTVPVKYLLQPPFVPVNFQTKQNKAHSQPVLAPLTLNQPVKVGSTQIQLLSVDPAIAQFTIRDQTWLWLDRLKTEQAKGVLATIQLPRAQVLWWAGSSIHPKIVEVIKPEIAIVSSHKVEPETIRYLQQQGIRFSITGQDGAIQWTPSEGIITPGDAVDPE